MISYAKLFKLLNERKITTYVLQVEWGIASATVQRLKKNMPVSTVTLDRLCANLNCKWDDIAEYIPDEERK